VVCFSTCLPFHELFVPLQSPRRQAWQGGSGKEAGLILTQYLQHARFHPDILVDTKDESQKG
jgi:hypothetical protein